MKLHIKTSIRRDFNVGGSFLFSILLLFCHQNLFSTVGVLDTTFNSSGGHPGTITTNITSTLTANAANGSAVQPDGKIVVVGSSGSLMAMARYTILGVLDTEFGSTGKITQAIGTTAVAYGVAIQNDGKIVVCGTSDSNFFVARFLANGSLDTAGFNAPTGYITENIGTVNVLHAVAIQPLNQKIVVAGFVDTAILVAQFTTAGLFDTSFYNFNGEQGFNADLAPDGTTNIAYAVAFDSSYNIVIAGVSGANMIVARYLSTGFLDTIANGGSGFNQSVTPGYNVQSLSGSAAVGYGVGFQSIAGNAGKIIVAGTDGTHAAVVRFTTAGVLDTTTFGVSSSGYNVANTFGATTAIAYGVAMQSDDTIVIGGTAFSASNPQNNFVIARYLANGSALDTTFDPSTGYTSTDIGTNSVDNGQTLTMQQNGRFIVAGTTNADSGDFATARYLGNAAPQGCMDVTYPATITGTDIPGFITYPTDTTTADKPQVIALQALSNNKVYVVTQTVHLSTEPQLVQLNADGSTALSSVFIPSSNSGYVATDVIVDSEQRALVVGTVTSHGWIRRSTSSTSLAADSSFGSSGFVTESTNSSSFLRVGEQKAGRVVVIGQSTTASTGLVIAYNEAGVLASTANASAVLFGTGGPGAFTGLNTITNATFKDLLIDSSDNIYIAYLDTSANLIKIVKLTSDGSTITTTINTGLSTATYTGTPVIAFNKDFSTITLAVTDSSGNIALQQYLTASPYTLTSGSIPQTTNLLSTPVLTKLQCDTDNRLLFTGYDNNVFVVGRLGSNALTLDTTFAPYSSTPGILKTMYDDYDPTSSLVTLHRASNCVCIAPSGAILFGGYENVTALSDIPVVGQVVGDPTPYTQVARYPGATVPGILNSAFGINGALDLFTTTAVPHGQPKIMNVLATNKILLADANGTDTNLAQLTSAYALDTVGFGSASSGKILLSGLVTPTAIMVDTTAANYYILGQNSTPVALLYKVNAAGTTGGTALATTTLSAGYAITQQASGRILVAGYSSANSSGVIVAYTPAGVIDTSFNPGGTGGAAPHTAGYWYTGVAHPIMSISVGATSDAQLDADKIFFAYQNGSTAIAARLLENGTALDSNFTFGTGIASVSSDTQIRMQLDSSGRIALVANTGATNGVQAARYTTAGANSVAAATIITNTSGQLLENILTLSDGTTLILAAVPNATASSAFMNMARLTSSFILDTTFNPLGTVPGILTTNVPVAGATPVIEDYYALDVISTGGILVTGDNSQTASSADPYLTEVENTSIVTKVSQSATSLGAAGALDTTFNPAGTNPGFMNLAAELQTTQFPAATTAKVLLQKTNGLYYVAGSTGSNSYVTLMSDDDVQSSTFGTSGLLTITSQLNLSSLLIAQTGTLLVAGGTGSSGSHAGWLQSYSATSGSTPTAGFTPPTGTNALDAIYAIAQQTNGRILVAGSAATVGTIRAYNSVTGAVDTSFATNGVYTATGYTAINSMIVDTSNNIYFIANDGSNNAKVIKLAVSGTIPTSGWTTPTTVTANSSIAANNHLGFNQAGNIVAVAVETSGTVQIVINYITASSGAAATVLDLPNSGGTPTGITTPNVTSVVVDLNTSPGKVIVTGYDSAATPNTPFILRTNTTLTALDTTFNTTGVQEYNTVTGGVTTQWYAGMINADGKITVAGYASVLTDPYMMRVYGDDFIGQYSPSLTPLTAGTPGTIDTNFGTSGEVLLASLSGASALAGQTPQVVLPDSSGNYYIAFTDGHLARLTNGAVLDSSYNSTGFAVNSNVGIYSMLMIANGGLLLAGTTGGHGWLEQYTTAGIVDTTFNSGAALTISASTNATVAVQQSSSRIVVAGTLASGNGALFAFTNTGVIDTTFNSNGTAASGGGGGVTPGIFGTGVATSIYAMVADQYDRLIIAYKNGSAVDIVRLTSAGQRDITFGSSGVISGAISALVDDATQVRLALDSSGNIVVAAHLSTPTIAVKAYANGSGTSVVETQLNINISTAPTLTDLIATADGKILVAGSQGTTPFDMWVARLVNSSGAYALDTSTSIPVAGNIPFASGATGIMQFQFTSTGSTSARALNSIAIYGDGEIAMVGTETVSSVVTPYLSMAYDTSYTTQEAICLDSKTDGTNDITLGASSATATNLGVTFFVASATTSASGQVARAVALENDANILVAVDGGPTNSDTESDIFLQMFTIDGTPNTNFGTNGNRTVLSSTNGYQNQYVRDMVTFTTTAGINKAILAGYAIDSTLGITGSLLLQYNVTTPGLDTTNFGGFDNNLAGIAFGDAQNINVVAQQSSGRIIVAGQSQDLTPGSSTTAQGLLLGYTAEGKLDNSFGTDGYLTVSASNALFTHAIDTDNRVVIAYRGSGNTVYVTRYLADGSAPDSSFNSGNPVNTTISVGASGNSFMRVAVDSSNNVYVAAVTSGTTVTINSYHAADGTTLYTSFTPTIGTLTAFTLSKLLIDIEGNVIVVGYDTNGGSSEQVVIARSYVTGGALALDPTFNPTPGTPGYLKYAVAAASIQAAIDALIHPDGRIIVVGADN